MIQIKNKEGRDLGESCNEHFDNVVSFLITRRRPRYFLSKKCWLRNTDNLKQIVTFKFNLTEDIESLLDEFENRGCTKLCNCRKHLKKIFNWDSFAETYAQELAEKLNVNVCPYCR